MPQSVLLPSQIYNWPLVHCIVIVPNPEWLFPLWHIGNEHSFNGACIMIISNSYKAVVTVSAKEHHET